MSKPRRCRLILLLRLLDGAELCWRDDNDGGDCVVGLFCNSFLLAFIEVRLCWGSGSYLLWVVHLLGGLGGSRWHLFTPFFFCSDSSNAMFFLFEISPRTFLVTP